MSNGCEYLVNVYDENYKFKCFETFKTNRSAIEYADKSNSKYRIYKKVISGGVFEIERYGLNDLSVSVSV